MACRGTHKVKSPRKTEEVDMNTLKRCPKCKCEKIKMERSIDGYSTCQECKYKGKHVEFDFKPYNPIEETKNLNITIQGNI